MSSAKLAFGIEIELLLRPSARLSDTLDKLCPNKDWQKTLEDVKQKEVAAQGKGPEAEASAKKDAELIRALFRRQLALLLASNHNLPVTAKSRDFTEWSVVDEVSLDEIPGYVSAQAGCWLCRNNKLIELTRPSRICFQNFDF